MKSILFIDGTKGFSPHRIENKACGGIITSLTLIPRYLAKKRHDVTVLSLYEKIESIKGVKYTNDVKCLEYQYDVVVFNRNVINRGVVSKCEKAKKIWWLHDIVDHRYLQDDGFMFVDNIVALSQYCIDSYSDFYEINKNKFEIIPNGVDHNIFYPARKAKNPNLFVTASAPIKGMYPLEFTLHNLKRANLDIELRVYSSQKLHDLDNTHQMDCGINNLANAGATILDPVPQKELADTLREAWCFLMPNHYPEICSNLLLQAQACKTPVISSPIGSVPEFIKHGHNGLLTETYPHDMFWWWKDYAELSLKILDTKLHNNLSNNALMPKSWEEIGEQWENLIKS